MLTMPERSWILTILLSALLLMVCPPASRATDGMEMDTGADASIGIDEQGKLYLRDGNNTITLRHLIDFVNVQTQAMTDLREQMSLLSGVVDTQSATITSQTNTIARLQEELELVNNTASKAHDSLVSVSANMSIISTEFMWLHEQVTNSTADTRLQSQVSRLENIVAMVVQHLQMFIPTISTRLWVELLSGSGDDVANDIAVDSVGNLCIAGSTQSPMLRGIVNPNGESSAIVVAKLSNNGTLLWMQLIAPLDNYGSSVITTDSSDNIYAARGSTLAKFSSNGTRQWTKDIGYDFTVTEIAADVVGNVLTVSIAGIMAKYSPSGDQLWSGRGGTGRDASGFVTDSTGNVYIIGQRLVGGEYAMILFAYSSSGTQLWFQTLGCDGRNSFGIGIAIDNAGDIYVTGSSDCQSLGGARIISSLANQTLGGASAISPGANMILAKFSVNGTRMWVKVLGGTQGRGIATDSAGYIYLTGSSKKGYTTVEDIMLTKLSNNGTEIWTQLLGGAQYDYGNGIATDNDGHVYIVGTTGSSSLDGSSSNDNPGDAMNIVVAKYET
eukprot:m.34790 g.34790  ORF g.34790 m.34790 type:complete len:556 (+) comp11202_c0_seq3:67-1734(+)